MPSTTKHPSRADCLIMPGNEEPVTPVLAYMTISKYIRRMHDNEFRRRNDVQLPMVC